MRKGLPQIDIMFKSLGLTAIERSARGIVALILHDDTEGGAELTIYNSITDVDPTQWSERNFEHIKLVYEGVPTKVIIYRMGTENTNYNAALKVLTNYKWNYLTIPGINEEGVTTVSAFIKESRDQQHKTFKAVLPNCKADHEGIINFTTDNIQSSLSKTAFSTAEYCARICGILAGLSLTRTCTYYVLNDIISADTPQDPDERVDKGELILIFDGENFKIGRGVNSLVSFTTDKGEDFSVIKIVEGMDLYQDDIRDTFEKSYVGKIRNDYPGKQMFVAALRAYQKSLTPDVLDQSFDNTAEIDVTAQRQYIESKGIDTSSLDDTAMARYNTGSHVFISSHVKFVNAMEDLTLVCHM